MREVLEDKEKEEVPMGEGTLPGLKMGPWGSSCKCALGGKRGMGRGHIPWHF